MKVYTVKDLETFERDEHGRLICPSGDYTQIKFFVGRRCIFGAGCVFGDNCIFGDFCDFGAGCRFGRWCIFGAGCVFGDNCRFGEWCRFGRWCVFGKNSKPENTTDKIVDLILFLVAIVMSFVLLF